MGDGVAVDVAIDVGAVGVADGVADEEGTGVKVTVAHAFVEEPEIGFFVFGVGVLSIGIAGCARLRPFKRTGSVGFVHRIKCQKTC